MYNSQFNSIQTKLKYWFANLFAKYQNVNFLDASGVDLSNSHFLFSSRKYSEIKHHNQSNTKESCASKHNLTLTCFFLCIFKLLTLVTVNLHSSQKWSNWRWKASWKSSLIRVHWISGLFPYLVSYQIFVCQISGSFIINMT